MSITNITFVGYRSHECLLNALELSRAQYPQHVACGMALATGVISILSSALRG